MEKLDYITHLENDTAQFLQLIESLQPKQLELKPEDKWSVLENLEHILLVEEICIKMLASPSVLIHEKTERIGKEMLQRLIIDRREKKISAPEVLHPKGSITSIQKFKEVFIQQRKQLQTQIQQNQLIIDNRMYKHPFLGEMTVVDWLYFIPIHTNRHLIQIQELVKF
jgi:hypothetical protein